MNRKQFLQTLSHAGYADLVTAITPHVRDAINIGALRSADGDETIPVGTSKFGGSPDVPYGFAVPTSSHGAPMALLAQIALLDVAMMDTEGLLPHTGTLAVFYDSVQSPWEGLNRDGFGVYYFPANVPLFRANSDTTVRAISGEMVAPLPATMYFSPRCQVTAPAWKTIKDTVTIDVLNSLQDSDTQTLPQHQLLGYANPIQRTPSEMAANCEQNRTGTELVDHYDPESETYVSGDDYELQVERLYAAVSRQWIALFQLDGDDALEWSWGDAGRVYFLIHCEDLSVQRFEATQLYADCC